MADVTTAEFYREMQVLRDHIDTRHKSIRDSLENRFDVLTAKLDDHAKDDRVVETRVTVIETERRTEGQAAVKRATYIGMLSAMLTSATIATVNYFRAGP